MKTSLKKTAAISFLLFASLVEFSGPLAADVSKDPLDGAFFPPEMVMLASDRIDLTDEQREKVRGAVEQLQARAEELRTRSEREGAALGALAKKDHIDEKALMAQLDQLLDTERDAKRLQLRCLAKIKNVLTPEQQSKLRDFAKEGAPEAAERLRKRLTEKVERVQAGAQEWAERGRDPSAILKTMEEKFKPLMESGKIREAEAELDRVLERLAE